MLLPTGWLRGMPLAKHSSDDIRLFTENDLRFLRQF